MSAAGERRKMLARFGEFPVHPHTPRRACGYKLANDGQDTRAVQHYPGHKNIQNCRVGKARSACPRRPISR